MSGRNTASERKRKAAYNREKGYWPSRERLWKRYGIKTLDEVSLRDDRVSGRVDFFLRFHKGYPQIPMELKTTLAFDKFCSEPMLEHLLQLRWYLQQQPDSPYGLLCYVNLSGWGGRMGEKKVLVIPRDDAQVKARVDHLWKVVHQGKEPPCEEPSGVEKCFWCSIASGTEMMPT